MRTIIANRVSKSPFFFAIIASSVLPCCAFAGVTPVSATLSLDATANAGNNPPTDFHSVSDGTTLNPLSTSAFAQDYQLINGGSQISYDSAKTSASASWSSASSGHITLNTELSSGQMDSQSVTGVGTGSQGFIYSFITDAASTLTLSYNITFSGEYSYGLHPLFYLENGSGGVISWTSLPVPGSGTLSYPLQAGQEYAIQLADNSNLYQFSTFDSAMSGTYSYQIAPVPEPTTCALMVVSILPLLFSIRRGQPRPATRKS
ncbi:MAG TPA: hypothetical protein VFB72_04040 [Verrucomicrobiae bacterium]|nr:hypothetical protein [Verrucomicrobiae bacterium]